MSLKTFFFEADKNLFTFKIRTKKLNSCAILSIESEMTQEIQFEDIIQNFVEKKARRKQRTTFSYNS
jgi:hypothetical protein